MTEIRVQLKALKTELTSMGIKNAQVTPYPALPPKKIEALEKRHKCRLPDALRAYYGQTNGQRISWSVPDAGVVAHSLVSDVQTFLTGRIAAYYNGTIRTDAPFYSKYLEPDQKRTLDTYWVFEQLYAGSFVLIPKQSDTDAIPLFLLEYPYRPTRLELSFSAYIEKLFANKALLNWQQQYKEQEKDLALVASFERNLDLVQNCATSRQRPPKKFASIYETKLDDLVKRIRSNRKVQLVQVDRYPLPPVNGFKKIESTFQSSLPEAMVDFYSNVNGFKLIWRTQPDVLPATAGTIDILPLERAFGGEHFMLTIDWDEFVTYKTLWDDELKETAPDDYLALKNKRVFDRHLGRNQVLMEVTKGGVAFFYYVDGRVSRLDVQFEDVLDMAFNTGGTEYYPELFASSGAHDERFFLDMQEKIRVINPHFEPPPDP